MKSADHKKLELPDGPGVYFFRDSASDILYIGRATSLRDRTKSYFSNDLGTTRGPHMVQMVQTATTITWQETPTVMDAILLESALIHKYKPYYNTKEKDDKSGTYIIITREEFPRIFTERWRTYTMNRDNYRGAELYGPFSSAAAANDILRFIRKSLPFLDKKSDQKHHARFYSQLGLVPTSNNNESVPHLRSTTVTSKKNVTSFDGQVARAYRNRITQIKKILSGKRSEVITEIESKMKLASKKQDFELAAKYRDALRHLGRVSDMKFIRESLTSALGQSVRIEAYDTSHFGGKNHIGVMTVLENNEPLKSEYRSFIIRSAGAADDIAATQELLSRRLRHPEWTYPSYIVIDGGETHLKILEHTIRQSLPPEIRSAITVVSVVKDEKHQPRDILSSTPITPELRKLFILANSEAHRFAVRVMHARNRKSVLAKKR